MSATNDRNSAVQREIEAREQREANAMLRSDASTLQTLWADEMVVNSTANLIAGKQILLEMVRNGRLKLRIYDSRPVRIEVFTDLVGTTGHEISQLIGDTAVFKLFTSYMNVWTKLSGNWQLLARHVGVIQRERPEPLQ